MKMKKMMRVTALENEDSDSVEDDENYDHDVSIRDNDEMMILEKMEKKNLIMIELTMTTMKC